MSMLTPPGMGGKKFRVTGDRYPRMRRPRHRRRVLAVLGSVAALGLLGFGTLQLVDVFTSDGSASAAPQAKPATGQDDACEPASEAAAGVELPEPAAVTVNIYNATTRTGLAQDTADALAERGFTIGEVTNAPEDLDGTVEAPGLLLGTEAANESGAVDLLTTQLAGAETGEAEPITPPADPEDAEDPEAPPAADPATSVDLVLGDGFTELTSADEAEALLAELTATSAEPANC
ncbi:LytR C-terminal domain-containing protein [Streptomyces triticirhizae]|uniref:LytR family transcriptional regulator n=1 Tax=Streptomyces triticirhizae TaxID=2483353 RepID=A0A3M2LTB1_9ACTN|nr:LytR C-terminal domain-containing protein [Streptomyces triticirhizae]RMI39813.1 LytR family transcriptional regulator [Streptomyces triticirhizae]